MSFSWARAIAIVVATLVLVGACGAGSGTQEMWIADDYVQCNQFDEPYRECLLVSHGQFELYRHLEGEIEGFDFEPGTHYVLEVEPIEGSDPTSWRLVKVLSAE